MQWRGRRESGNVNDQRGSGGGGGGGFNLPGGLFSKGGLITVVIIFIVSWLTGTNPLTLLQQVDTSGGSSGQAIQVSAEDEERAQFVKVVLADTEDVWHKLLSDYREPTLEMFTDQVQSACGQASASSGPFYCSEDERVYIDLSFYDELQSKLNAPGDFAQAYVIAHEVGHHVQHLMGITDKIHAMKNDLSEEDYNKLSVKLELQADFFAGVWAHHDNEMKNILEPGDIDEALNAASAIGDDRLQKQFQGYVVPDSFTHGTSAQRVFWFRKGFETGDIKQGDTFSDKSLD
ncbi:MAG: flagellar biosynthesis protein FlgM [Cyclobacteriaceae bacterium]|nr:flagellar biosynthesis protein FlgM [Cyclobacteriaceae bacterium]